ncbi:meteorin-like protein [Gastrophryne carolinensis]
MFSRILLSLFMVIAMGRGASLQYTSDLCNWKGSGLTHESHKKEVEQVYLRCSEGSVEWMYPTGALIVNLNTFSSASEPLTVCIKPFKDSKGSNIYLEKTGELKMLFRDGENIPNKVYCFSQDKPVLFIEATPQLDISRKITGFQYELISRRTLSDLHAIYDPCRPCSDTEVLLAVCISDFVVKGSITEVTSDLDQQESIIVVSVDRLFRQKSKIFQHHKERPGWEGRIRTPLECGVKAGQGEFLFTGRLHFGMPRLGCAPRYRDFQRIYQEAKTNGLNPCEINTD